MDKSNNRRQLKILQIVAAQMSATLVILGGIAYALAGTSEPSASAETVRPFFIFLSLLFLAGSVGLSRFLRRPSTPAASGQAKYLAALRADLFKEGMIRLALAEMPLLLGFVLSVLTGEFVDYGLLAGFSAVGLVLVWPRSSQWEMAEAGH